MTLLLPQKMSRKNDRWSRQWAFTLTEMMIATSIFVMVVAGVLASQLFGMRLMEVTNCKLNTSTKARQIIKSLSGDISTAQLVRVGTGSSSSFTEAAPNTLQQGSAIQIYPSTDTNVFIRYFWDATDTGLKRKSSGTTATVVLANSISNSVVFTSEDYAGLILTNGQNNSVIGINLQFYSLENGTVPIGAGKYYKSYQLRTKITQRAP